MENILHNQRSYFDEHTLKELYKDVRKTYKSNNYPWVIGYSGGKDSTATVQLVWYALSKLPVEERNKKVFVISSDTLVETPVVVEQINKTLKQIAQASIEQKMPFITQKVTPKIEDSFWVKLIGMGYPTPSRQFRWCTDRLKIKPANTFIIETAARFGEVVMVLGARKAESLSRAQVMNKRDVLPGTNLSRHSSLPRAWVYTPLEDFITDDVWTYLLQVESPWGGNNRDLAALYRTAQSGECPLVVDTSTPSCGNSRFGCWVCTVVEKDKTMQSLIDNGEEWMEPLLDFRDKLAETQNPERKLEFRGIKRRNGKVMVKDGRLIPGPYLPQIRMKMLRELLELQIKVQNEGPDPDLVLISAAELHEIRRIWRSELSDWVDTVPQIYREITGQELEWIEDEIGSFSSREFEIVKDEATKQEVPTELVTRLLDVERQMQSMGRRSRIFNEIHHLFDEDWVNKIEAIERANLEKTRQLELGID
jgi:DNA sulfur modification protein DndC